MRRTTTDSRWASARRLMLIAIFTIGLAPLHAFADNISLFIVTGQSNARSNYALGIEAGLRASGEYERVVVFHKRHGGNWLNQWILNEGGGVYSPGTNMTNDLWASDGSSELQQLIASLEADGHTVKVEGFFWFQGESDTINAGSRATYQARFEWMISTLRSHYGNFDLLVTLVDWNHDLTDQLIQDGYMPEWVDELRQVLIDTAASLGGVHHDSRGYPRSDLWHVSVSDDPRGFYAAVTDLGADQAGVFLDHTICEVDLNRDGLLDFFDVSAFLQAFNAGCP